MFRFFSLSSMIAVAVFASACSDDSPEPANTGGNAGSAGAGNAGSSAEAGSAGASGEGGSAGSASTAGSAGSANAAGSAGSGSTANADLSFFVTSEGSGKAGGNLGGLDGADQRCQTLAAAVGAGSKTWRAYLSTSTVDARDRIGDGPWVNAAGDTVAENVAGLHDADGLPNGDPQYMMDENGDAVPGNEHDILTGSTAEGTVFLDDMNGNAPATCDDWTSNSADPGGPRVGHSDIPANPMFSPSWNTAHTAPACDQQSLNMVGGAGRLYCFAE